MPQHEFVPNRPVSPEERIRQLIESGDAVDIEDAQELLREEEDAAFFRSINQSEYLAEIDEALHNPETDSMLRWDLNFRKAVVATAETPDELEFLWYQALLDLPTGKSSDEAVLRRRDSTRRRLEKKTGGLVERIGSDRAQELFNRYRTRLQELFEKI